MCRFRRRNIASCDPEAKDGSNRAIVAMALLLVFSAYIALGFIVSLTAAQSDTQQKPSFDVASIKLNKIKGADFATKIERQPGGRVLATNCPLSIVVAFAYGLESSYQVREGPNWIRSDRWDIDARVGEKESPPPNVLALMLQSLLENRFKLRFHKVTQELPVYVVTVAKSGLKLKLSEDQSAPEPYNKSSTSSFDPLKPPRGNLLQTRGYCWGTAVDIKMFITSLRSKLGPWKPIVDKTGLTGRYDIQLKWTPSESDVHPRQQTLPPDSPFAIDASGPPFLTALEQQIGLEVNSAKAPYEVLVIESVQKPNEN
jgi:uncharacterized protein (TIGR03435 family)